MIRKTVKKSEYERIKQLVDIKNVIGKVVSLKRAGGYYRGCCPFHEEKTPSFIVYGKDSIAKSPNTFHCFGGQCGEHGDLIDFVSKYYNLMPHEALELLARENGVDLEYEERVLSPEEMYKDFLGRFFATVTDRLNENLIVQPESSDVKRYLYDRGITDDDIKKWRIGFGDDSFVRGEFLGKNFMDRQISLNEFRGIDVDRSNFFTNRIVFPIFDISGNPIAFSNRLYSFHENKEVQEERIDALKQMYGAKYINTSVYRVASNGQAFGSVLYEHKNSHLYGLNFARQHIRKSKGNLILVEGNIDVIAAHRNGILNSAGLMSAAINEDTADLLEQCKVRKVVVCLDGDEGGQGASEKLARAVQKANFKPKFHISIASLPSASAYKDPDSYLRLGSSEGFQSILADAKSISEFIVDREIDKSNLSTLSDKIEFIYKIKDELSGARNVPEIERTLVVDSLATKLGVSPTIVKEYLDYQEKKVYENLYSPISETIIIAELVHSEENRAELLSTVNESDYYYERNRRLHKLVMDLDRRRIPIDLNIVVITSKEEGLLDRYYDLDYLQSLGTTVRANVDFHAAKVVECSKKRKLFSLGNSIQDAISSSEDIMGTVGTVSKELYTINLSKDTDAFRSPRDEAFDYMMALERRLDNPGIEHGIYTGYPQFDDATQGLFPGQTMLVLARTSDGKTALAQNFVSNIALRNDPGIPIYYANLEMPPQQMMDRMMSIYTGIPIRRVTSGYMSNEKAHILRAAINNYAKRDNLHIQFIPDFTIGKLASILRYQIEKNGIKLAVVDYVQLMGADKDHSNLSTSDLLGVISRGITGLAKLLEIPIIIIAQANRDTVTNNQGRPELQHIYGSDKFSHDVDIAVSLQAKTAKVQEAEGWLTPEEMIQKGYEIRNKSGVIDPEVYKKWRVGKYGNYWMHILKNRRGQKDVRLSLWFHKYRLTFEEVPKG